MNTARIGLNLASDIWTSGNWWVRRLLIAAIGWHLATLGVGLIGVSVITILFMVTVGSVLAILAVWYGQPLIPILAAFTAGGRTVIHWIMAVVCFELVLGIYLATVPVGANWTTRGLALLAIGAAFTALVLKINHLGWKMLTTILWLKFIILTLAIYAYGLMPDVVSASKESWHKWQGETAEKIRRGEPLFASSAAISNSDLTSRQQPSRHDTKNVDIRPDQDSGWIEVQVGKHWECTFPGTWLGFTFDNGEKVGVAKSGGTRTIILTHADGTTEQLSQFPDPSPTSRFMVRGDGKTVTISY